MRSFAAITFFCAATALQPAMAYAQPAVTGSKLLEACGQKQKQQMAGQVASQFAQYKQMLRNKAPDRAEEAAKLVDATFADLAVEIVSEYNAITADMYDRIFTPQERASLAALYDTQAGCQYLWTGNVSDSAELDKLKANPAFPLIKRHVDTIFGRVSDPISQQKAAEFAQKLKPKMVEALMKKRSEWEVFGADIEALFR
ncbi:MAG: hypothetical protein KBB36_02145 [Ferrovibrio sp.]|nr:hypothetical protein [Ferrovibrio sp.]